MPLFTSGGLVLGLGLVSSDLGLGLKNLVLFTSLAVASCLI